MKPSLGIYNFYVKKTILYMNVNKQLLEIIRSNPRFSSTEKHYVSIYRSESAYGGPEEGGWWKDYNFLEGSVSFPTLEQAEEYLEHTKSLAEKMQQQANKAFRDAFVANHRDNIDYQDDFCRGESCSAPEYFVYIETTQGSLDNSDEPIGHYE